jgi:hypothetical protein
MDAAPGGDGLDRTDLADYFKFHACRLTQRVRNIVDGSEARKRLVGRRLVEGPQLFSEFLIELPCSVSKGEKNRKKAEREQKRNEEYGTVLRNNESENCKMRRPECRRQRKARKYADYAAIAVRDLLQLLF